MLTFIKCITCGFHNTQKRKYLDQSTIQATIQYIERDTASNKMAAVNTKIQQAAPNLPGTPEVLEKTIVNTMDKRNAQKAKKKARDKAKKDAAKAKKKAEQKAKRDAAKRKADSTPAAPRPSKRSRANDTTPNEKAAANNPSAKAKQGGGKKRKRHPKQNAGTNPNMRSGTNPNTNSNPQTETKKRATRRSKQRSRKNGKGKDKGNQN